MFSPLTLQLRTVRARLYPECSEVRIPRTAWLRRLCTRTGSSASHPRCRPPSTLFLESLIALDPHGSSVQTTNHCSLFSCTGSLSRGRPCLFVRASTRYGDSGQAPMFLSESSDGRRALNISDHWTWVCRVKSVGVPIPHRWKFLEPARDRELCPRLTHQTQY